MVISLLMGYDGYNQNPSVKKEGQKNKKEEGKMATKKNITINDISAITGFSRQTVSRVISGSANVKNSTREKILQAIKEYNYKPNIYARNLSGNRKNKNILLSVKSNMGHTASIWLNLLINNLISENDDADVTLFIEQFYNEQDFSKSILNTTNSFVDGVIIFYEEANDNRIKILEKAGIPYIIYGTPYHETATHVGLDNKKSIIKACEYFFQKEMTDIVFISAFPTPVNLARENAMIEAYQKNAIDISQLRIVKNIKNQEQVYDLTKELYAKEELPELIFVSGDEKAIGALKALNELKVQVPDEVSVMGIDNIPISKYFSPALSTIDFDYGLIARTILKKLLHLIAGQETESQEFEGELLIRESVR